MIEFGEMLCCKFETTSNEQNNDNQSDLFIYRFGLSLLHVLAHELVIAHLSNGIFQSANDYEMACLVDVHTLCVRIDSKLSQSVVDAVKQLVHRIISKAAVSDIPQLIPAMVDVLDEVVDSSKSDTLLKHGDVFIRNQAILRTFVYRNVRNSNGFSRTRELITSELENGPDPEESNRTPDLDPVYQLDPKDPDSGQ